MGTSIKKEQKVVCKIMKTIFQKHHANLESFNFRWLLLWVFHNTEGVDGVTQKQTKWEWGCGTASDSVAKDLFGPQRLVYSLDPRLVSPRKEPDLQSRSTWSLAYFRDFDVVCIRDCIQLLLALWFWSLNSGSSPPVSVICWALLWKVTLLSSWLQDLDTIDKYSIHDVDGLLERICTTRGAGAEAIGAQEFTAESADPEPVAHPSLQIHDTHSLRVGAGAVESCCWEVWLCLDSHSFQLLALMQCVFLILSVVVAVAQYSRKFWLRKLNNTGGTFESCAMSEFLWYSVKSFRAGPQLKVVKIRCLADCQRFQGWSGPVPRLVGQRDFAKSAPPGGEIGDSKIIKNSGNNLRRNKIIY